MSRATASLVLSVALGLGGAGSALASPEAPAALRLRAVTVNVSGFGRARLQRVRIVVDRWSTDAEQAKLFETLARGGSDGLLREMRDVRPRAGFLQVDDQLRWPIQYAQERTAADGTRSILLVTDRPLSFREAIGQPRSSTYGFTVLQIRIDKNGEATGELVPAARIGYDAASRTVAVENFTFGPMALSRIAEEK